MIFGIGPYPRILARGRSSPTTKLQVRIPRKRRDRRLLLMNSMKEHSLLRIGHLTLLVANTHRFRFEAVEADDEGPAWEVDFWTAVKIVDKSS